MTVRWHGERGGDLYEQAQLPLFQEAENVSPPRPGCLRVVREPMLTIAEAENVHICWERAAPWCGDSKARRNVLICMVRGMTIKEMAKELDRSPRVIRQDIERLYDAAGLKGALRSELVTRAQMPIDKVIHLVS